MTPKKEKQKQKKKKKKETREILKQKPIWSCASTVFSVFLVPPLCSKTKQNNNNNNNNNKKLINQLTYHQPINKK